MFKGVNVLNVENKVKVLKVKEKVLKVKIVTNK